MDCDRSKRRTSKILSVAGCMLLLLPVGFDTYWGNASIYVISFMASRLEPVDEFLISTSIPLFMVADCTLVLVSGYLLRRVDTAVMVILGVICCNASLLLSYFAVQHSMVLLNLTAGGLLGVGTGTLYSCALHIAIERAQGDEGFLCALILAGYAIGGPVNCQIMMWYVNPKNENPHLKMGSLTIFTNKDIIDRVPSMFLFLGGFMLIVHVLGMLLLLMSSRVMSDKKPSEKSLERMYLTAQSSASEKMGQKPPGSTAEEQQKTPKVRQDRNQKTPGSDMEPREFGDVGMEARSRSGSQSAVFGDVGMEARSRSEAQSADTPMLAGNDSTPSEMLRHPAFYACWLSLFTSQISFNAAANFYKLFGLQWIPDDHFLGIIGALSTPSVTLCRLLCGAALDRFGPKMSVIGFQMAIVVFGAWFVFTPMVNRWLYMFFTLVFVGVNGALYGGTCGIVARIFGKTHIATNVGYLLTSAIAANIVVPFVIDFLRQFGWFSLFAGTSGIHILSICFCLRYLSSATP